MPPTARKRRRPGALPAQRRIEGGEGPTVFTIGYSGHTPSSFVEALRAASVVQVLDVRSFPRSRKPGFSKEQLREFLEGAGVAYVHLPPLGAPKELLARKKGGETFADFAPLYVKHLDRQGAAIDEAAGLARRRASALMCLEKEPSDCHRGILARRLEARGLRVIHL